MANMVSFEASVTMKSVVVAVAAVLTCADYKVVGVGEALAAALAAALARRTLDWRQVGLQISDLWKHPLDYLELEL